MASTGIDVAGSRGPPPYSVPRRASDDEKKVGTAEDPESPEIASIGKGDHTVRKLKSRHIQLIGTVEPS